MKPLHGLLGRERPIVYVKIQRQWLAARHVGQNRVSEFVPQAAVVNANNRWSIAAIGDNAAETASGTGLHYDLVNPFDHPRVLVSDPVVAEALLKYCLGNLIATGPLRPRPTLVLHPLRELEGDLTVLETSALHQIALGAGAADGYVWYGEDLSDDAVIRGVHHSGTGARPTASPYRVD